MRRPVILAVDDESDSLHTLRHDLRTAFGSRCKVLTAHSFVSAEDLLDHIEERGEQVALLVVDVDLESAGEPLVRLTERVPDAAVVVIAPHDRDDRVIELMEPLGASHWIPRPWAPAERLLVPVLEDAYGDWAAHNVPDSEAVELIGHRWARDSHALKDFLGRNLVPFRWLDLDRGREGAALLERAGLATAKLPVALLPDGRALEDPSVDELADALGMHTHPESSYCDVAIVGGGPAGLAAAVYGASEGLATVLIERDAPGGQAGTSSRIENYLGFPAGVSGADLAHRALTQAKKFGVEILAPREVVGLRIGRGFKTLHLDDGAYLTCRALVIATGVSYKALHAPGLAELAGAGVYYGAATTEAHDAAGQEVYVVGSANSAGQGAMYFSRFAERVVMLVRGPDLTAHMSQYLIDQIEETPNVTVTPHTVVAAAHGAGRLERLTLEDSRDGSRREVEASYLFVFIGAEPRNEWLGDAVLRDDHGYILAGADTMVEGSLPRGWDRDRHPFHLETSVPGIFVAGDARHGSIRRVAGAVGEGSTAIQLVHRYLAEPA